MNVEDTERPSWPKPKMGFRIATYRLFISHRYARSHEYQRLVAMLDRETTRDRTWRWQNLSVPMDAPIMTDDEAQRAEVYNARIGERLRSVHAILFIGTDEWLDDAGSLYNELVEAKPPDRLHIPTITVIPRGCVVAHGARVGPEEVAVRWNAAAIVAAVRAHAVPALPRELVLSPAERRERAAIVRALRAHPRGIRAAARSLGMTMPELREKRRQYIID